MQRPRCSAASDAEAQSHATKNKLVDMVKISLYRTRSRERDLDRESAVSLHINTQSAKDPHFFTALPLAGSIDLAFFLGSIFLCGPHKQSIHDLPALQWSVGLGQCLRARRRSDVVGIERLVSLVLGRCTAQHEMRAGAECRHQHGRYARGYGSVRGTVR